VLSSLLDLRKDLPLPPESAAETDVSPAVPASLATEDAHALTDLILARLDDDQAQDVIVIDLKDKSPLADAIVVATGRSQRHVSAMADHLLRSLKEGGYGKAQVEGLPQGDWVLIDALDVIVHLFRPEVRSFYNIEKIWSVEPPHPLGGDRPSVTGHNSGHNPVY
jgi:ribosome-associated protein